MIDRCYIEITNVCNLSCDFCPKHNRAERRMTAQEFDLSQTEFVVGLSSCISISWVSLCFILYCLISSVWRVKKVSVPYLLPTALYPLRRCASFLLFPTRCSYHYILTKAMAKAYFLII